MAPDSPTNTTQPNQLPQSTKQPGWATTEPTRTSETPAAISAPDVGGRGQRRGAGGSAPKIDHKPQQAQPNRISNPSQPSSLGGRQLNPQEPAELPPQFLPPMSGAGGSGGVRVGQRLRLTTTTRTAKRNGEVEGAARGAGGHTTEPTSKNND